MAGIHSYLARSRWGLLAITFVILASMPTADAGQDADCGAHAGASTHQKIGCRIADNGGGSWRDSQEIAETDDHRRRWLDVVLVIGAYDAIDEIGDAEALERRDRWRTVIAGGDGDADPE